MELESHYSLIPSRWKTHLKWCNPRARTLRGMRSGGRLGMHSSPQISTKHRLSEGLRPSLHRRPHPTACFLHSGTEKLTLFHFLEVTGFQTPPIPHPVPIPSP